MSSTLYRVREPFPDAVSALSRARAIMRDLAEWTAPPWPRVDDITTAEQFAYALATFPTARFGADREPHGVPFLNELRRRRVVTLDTEQSKSYISGDVRLRPDLVDLWPLPDGVGLVLATTPPFGYPASEPEDDCTEDELDRMVSVLGPLSLDVRWNCSWRGLPESKDCGVLLCLNSVWVPQHVEPSPREFGVWISLGPRVAWTPEARAWVGDSGLPLGEPQTGWRPGGPDPPASKQRHPYGTTRLCSTSGGNPRQGRMRPVTVRPSLSSTVTAWYASARCALKRPCSWHGSSGPAWKRGITKRALRRLRCTEQRDSVPRRGPTRCPAVRPGPAPLAPQPERSAGHFSRAISSGSSCFLTSVALLT